MQAITYDAYGPASVLRLADLPERAALSRGEVRVRVRRAALNPKDALFRKGRFRALSGRAFPKRCGLDAAGVVGESRSPHFEEGQRVFGCLDEWTFRRGTLAEEAIFRDHEIAVLPPEIDDASAAGMALTGLTALQALRDVARVAPGHRVLVHGASGGVGTAAIQVARILGAEIHTATSEGNRSLCAELGADTCWSYEGAPWMAAAPFDAIFDVFGNLRFSAIRGCLGRSGRFVGTVPSAGRVVRDLSSRLSFRRQERLVVVRPRRADLGRLAAWMVEGRLRTVVDSTFPLTEIQAAFARLESKRTRGKIIIAVA
jgi:NADPH:quinone reductase-like Zn-dependent oxidoreductase